MNESTYLYTMAFWHPPKRFYQIETSKMKDDLLSFLALKIEVAKENTGFSSLFKYPDYKLVTIQGDMVKITDATLSSTSWNVAGSIEMSFDDTGAGTIITARFLERDDLYGFTLTSAIIAVAGIAGFFFVATSLSYLMMALIVAVTCTAVFGMIKVSMKFTTNGLMAYLIAVLIDIGVTGSLKTITDVELS
ncbi:hypothetical protein [Mucilaginibacter ginsenosidivorax]|uniref:Uncharacterized protein n=1 Tax=Mucilaginibacter ginsenosidivorax TaxID=862126 RepID=A0A5B8W2H7_9SPHI|nr:hypothetical protein [Mucilaginibacter ginsenosidivorax]QEC78270.1 hypothetical protein FSB76_20850 [Mucilaginibacter ginsenosidivorax]